MTDLNDGSTMLNLRKVNRFRRALDPVAEIEGFDGDTGLAGRELLLQRVERQWKWCREHQQPICLMMVNVDHYGAYKAVYGHSAGTAALARVAQVISDCCRRRADFAGRVREDEFAVLLADAPDEGARQVAERIRHGIHATAGAPSAGNTDPLTASIGVACCVPSNSRFVMSVIHNADLAMKRAKSDGRNRVVVHADA